MAQEKNPIQFPHIQPAEEPAATPGAEPQPAAPAQEPAQGAAPAAAPQAPAQPAQPAAPSQDPQQPAAQPAAGEKPAAEPQKPANPWDGFRSGGNDAKALESLPDSAKAYLAKRLNLDPSAPVTQMAERFNARLAAAEQAEKNQGQSAFANEEISKLNELARTGANWREHVQADNKAAQIEQSIAQWKAATPKQVLEFALRQQAAQLGMPEDEFVRRNMPEDDMTIAQRGDQIRQQNVTGLEQQIQDLRSQQDQRVQQARSAQEAWKASAEKATQEYRDPHFGGPLNETESTSIAQALGSEMIETRLPKAFFDAVLATDGKLDPSKAVHVMAQMQMGDQKIEYLLTQQRNDTRKEEFLKQTNADPNNPAPAAPGTGTPAAPVNPVALMQEHIQSRNKQRLGSKAPATT